MKISRLLIEMATTGGNPPIKFVPSIRAITPIPTDTSYKRTKLVLSFGNASRRARVNQKAVTPSDKARAMIPRKDPNCINIIPQSQILTILSIAHRHYYSLLYLSSKSTIIPRPKELEKSPQS